jgi:hypothetical protein
MAADVVSGLALQGCGHVRFVSARPDCQEVAQHSCCEGKHERSNRWRLTTAVLGLALAAPVLALATGFREARFSAPVRLDRNPCTPGKSPDIVSLFHVRAALAPDSFGGHR